MNLRNIILLLTFSIFSQTLTAQVSGRGITPPEFNAMEKAGIIKYDLEKTIKKLKNTEDSIIKEITEYIQIYNIEMDKLLFLHSKTLEDLEIIFHRNLKIAIQNRDQSQMNLIKYKIEQIIPPIRNEVNKQEKLLNKYMKRLLTEKQNKKWLKYQKKIN